jgi:hypothetical protein
MKARQTVAAILATIVLSGCGHELPRGTVIGKSHQAAYTSWVFTGKVLIPIAVPERWILQLRSGDETGTHEVIESEWGRYQVGDIYP